MKDSRTCPVTSRCGRDVGWRAVMTHHQRTEFALLRKTAELAIDYLTELAERPVGRPIAPDALRAALGGDLPDRGDDPERVVARLARDVDPRLVATDPLRVAGHSERGIRHRRDNGQLHWPGGCPPWGPSGRGL